MTPQPSPTVHPSEYRRVLSHYPTGVVVISAIADDGQPAGLAVGSFTSVSLDPPLVAFLPDRSSTSFPRIRTSSSFCANILGAHQQDVCRVFATRGADKFAQIGWRPAPSGSPVLDGVVAWIDCEFHDIHEAGDHYIVLGLVRHLEAHGGEPLAFVRGGYGAVSVP